MAEIERTVARLRAALLKRDAETQRAVIAAYRTARDGIVRQAESLATELAGIPVGTAWRDETGRFTKEGERLFLQYRTDRLLEQVDAALARFERDAAGIIGEAQRSAVRTAQTDAAQLALAGMGPPPELGVGINFARLSDEALTDLIGTLQPGSPLRELLNGFGREVSAAVRDQLIQGLALGHGPNQVAKGIREAIGGKAWRARLIARDSLLRAYRSAAMRAYQANDAANGGVVKAWRWLAALGRRCCAACVAMHGRVFPLSTPFGSHPACRCTPTPITKTWRELGYEVPEPSFDIQTGPEWFDAQPADDQRFILGPTKHRLYEDDAIELRDLVRTTKSAKWGTSRTVASTDDALANAEARRRKVA